MPSTRSTAAPPAFGITVSHRPYFSGGGVSGGCCATSGGDPATEISAPNASIERRCGRRDMGVSGGVRWRREQRHYPIPSATSAPRQTKVYIMRILQSFRGLPMVAALGAATVTGCAKLATYLPGRTPAPAPAPVTTASGSSRPRPYPVFETQAFARAVARGTRTRTGEPGAKYWQQFARYHIDAELVPTTNQVNGRETVRYFNRSPDTLRKVYVFLNQNLFMPGAARTVPTPVTAGTEILRVAAWSQALARRDTGTGFAIDGTVMRINLPRALSPHDSLDLDVAWAFQVPPDGAPREGTTGDAYMVAYWYPQMAVYDDVNGWQTDPYLGTAEFYMDYADYDVNLTVPQGWLVAATGELTNPN